MRCARALLFFSQLLMITTLPGCATMSVNTDVHPWDHNVVYYYIDANLPESILNEQLEEAVIDAFEEWNALYCLNWPVFIYGGRAHAKFAQLGTCTDGEAIPIRGAIFITVRHQLWEDNAGYLGVTYTCYKAGTSVRISTAIALNFVHYHYAKLGETVAPDTYDLRRLITHEAGHAVAVDHHEATGREHTMGKHLYPGSYLGLSTHDTALACPTFRRLRPSLLTSTDP